MVELALPQDSSAKEMFAAMQALAEFGTQSISKFAYTSHHLAINIILIIYNNIIYIYII